MYNTTGGLTAGLIANLYWASKNYKETGVFWANQNFIVDGRLRWNHVVGFSVFVMLLFSCQNLVYLTIYFATAANINVGVITTIWSIDPVNMAVIDYWLFGQKLQYYHVVGVLSIVACSALVSLSGYFEGAPQIIED